MPMRKSFGQEPGKKPKKKSSVSAKASPSQSSARNAGAFRARPPTTSRPPSRGGR
jgi:hypothetical protein